MGTNILSKLYYDPRSGFVGPSKLHQKARKVNPSITLKQVHEWYASKDDVSRFQEQRLVHADFRIASRNPNAWQMDIVF